MEELPEDAGVGPSIAPESRHGQIRKPGPHFWHFFSSDSTTTRDVYQTILGPPMRIYDNGMLTCRMASHDAEPTKKTISSCCTRMRQRP